MVSEITLPSGTPLPPTHKPRFTPRLARALLVGPCLFLSKRSLRHICIHGLPFPIDSCEFVETTQTLRPEPLKNTCCRPLLKAKVGAPA